MLEILDGSSFVWVLKSPFYNFDFKFWIGVNKIWIFVVDILIQILLTFLTFIASQILRKVSICGGWFLLGLSYYVNFQFTPWRVINGYQHGEQNLSWNVYFIYFNPGTSIHLQKRGVWILKHWTHSEEKTSSISNITFAILDFLIKIQMYQMTPTLPT